LLVLTWPSRARSRVAALVVASAVLGSTLVVAAPALAWPYRSSAHAATVADVTTTSKAQKSIAFRKTVTLTQWQASRHGKRIAWRESHNVCTAVSQDGRFLGKWQMTESLWRAHGGGTFARTPQKATCREQDTVARRVWVQSWWWPWGG
jgi:hypothetical protein